FRERRTKPMRSVTKRPRSSGSIPRNRAFSPRRSAMHSWEESLIGTKGENARALEAVRYLFSLATRFSDGKGFLVIAREMTAKEKGRRRRDKTSIVHHHDASRCLRRHHVQQGRPGMGGLVYTAAVCRIRPAGAERLPSLGTAPSFRTRRFCVHGSGRRR